MELVRLTDKHLVARAARGDTGAFNLLVSRWEKRLFNYAFRLTGNREDALDVCQDTFLKAFQQLDRLQDPSRFAGWLFTIARNYCLAHFRTGSAGPRMAKDPIPRVWTPFKRRDSRRAWETCRSWSRPSFACWWPGHWTGSPSSSGRQWCSRFSRGSASMKSQALQGVR